MSRFLPWKIAAPSCVWPAHIGENCLHLQQLVQEVGITLFETEGSLDYGPKDLPLWLADLDLNYHVHLPLDLPWEEGTETVFAVCSELLSKTDYLKPLHYVLHPPPYQEQLPQFLNLWRRKKPEYTLLLENIQDNSLLEFWPWLRAQSLNVCLDLGHLLCYAQHALLQAPGLWPKVRMLHIYGDSNEHRHGGLDQLSGQGQAILHKALHHVSRDCTLVLEVFDPKDLYNALDIFSTWITNWGLQPE